MCACDGSVLEVYYGSPLLLCDYVVVAIAALVLVMRVYTRLLSAELCTGVDRVLLWKMKAQSSMFFFALSPPFPPLSLFLI